MINNRQQSGRRRGRGGQRQNGGGGGGGRSPEMGNRIDNRARGNAAQLLEKYKTLARDAQQGGDRVLAEYYLQFADHYFRVLAESRARYEEANPRARQERYDAEGENFDGDDGDGDDGDEFDAPQDRGNQDRGNQERPREANRDERPRESRPQPPRQYRDDRPRDDRPQQRDDRPQQRDDRSRDARPPRDDRPQRDDRPRADRPQRDDTRERPTAAPRYNGNGNGAEHDDDVGSTLPFDALPPAIGPILEMEPVAGVEGEPIVAPKRRGRPRKVATEAATEE